LKERGEACSKIHEGYPRFIAPLVSLRKQSLSYEISHFPADFGGAHRFFAWLHVGVCQSISKTLHI
jgi:hypothetical protein